jgi:hypothetical protein
VIQTLRELGCESEENEDERILFAYQGISFFIEAADDCLFIYLIWPWCYSFSKFDVDEFARVRKVVNELNTRGAISVFYGFSDSDEVAVHLKKHFIFMSICSLRLNIFDISHSLFIFIYIFPERIYQNIIKFTQRFFI